MSKKMFSLPLFSLMMMTRTVSGFSRAWSLTNAMLASTHVNEADLLLSSSVTSGAELAMQECSRQFSHDVWNCPVTAFNMNKEGQKSLTSKFLYLHFYDSPRIKRFKWMEINLTPHTTPCLSPLADMVTFTKLKRCNLCISYLKLFTSDVKHFTND